MWVLIQVAKLCVRGHRVDSQTQKAMKNETENPKRDHSSAEQQTQGPVRSRTEARSTPANPPDATSARGIPGLCGCFSLHAQDSKLPLKLSRQSIGGGSGDRMGVVVLAVTAAVAVAVAMFVAMAEPVKEAVGAVVGVGEYGWGGGGLGIEEMLIGVAGAGTGAEGGGWVTAAIAATVAAAVAVAVVAVGVGE